MNIANKKIKKLSNTDFLTDIFNRKYFFQRLKELVSLKKRKGCANIGIIFIDTLIKRADKNMYKAKKNGRDQVVFSL